MTTWTARCVWGRVEVTVEGEPGHVYACHCDFCQRRSGNVFIASALFLEDQVVSITGDTHCYNGLEVDGVGAVGIPGGINYRFCAVCGSSIDFDMIFPTTGQRFFTIALGCFVDDVFPPPAGRSSLRSSAIRGSRPFPTQHRSMTRWASTPNSRGARLTRRARATHSGRCGFVFAPLSPRERKSLTDRPKSGVTLSAPAAGSSSSHRWPSPSSTTTCAPVLVRDPAMSCFTTCVDVVRRNQHQPGSSRSGREFLRSIGPAPLALRTGTGSRCTDPLSLVKADANSLAVVGVMPND